MLFCEHVSVFKPDLIRIIVKNVTGTYHHMTFNQTTYWHLNELHFSHR